MEFKADWASFPRHYSTWLGVAAILFDAVYVFTDALALSPQTMVLINAAVPVGMKILQLLKQSIPVAPEVKQEMKETLRVLPTTKPEPEPAPAVTEEQGHKVRDYLDKAVADEFAEMRKQIEALSKQVSVRPVPVKKRTRS